MYYARTHQADLWCSPNSCPHIPASHLPTPSHISNLGDPEGVFQQILNKPVFRARFLPAELTQGLSAAAMRDRLLDTPFIKSFVEIYHCLRGFRAKRQHLSLFAPHFPCAC